MQISDIAKQYAGTTSSSEVMTGTRGVEKLVSSIRDLTMGNIFEGTVNSVKGGKVILGLSNGTLINARMDAGMHLTPGQSMFFQVKSNNGETIAIRPYTVGGNGVNLTLLDALNAAGLPVTDKYLNLANNMMQEHMPIDKNTMNQMARILMANPDMSVNTLVQMKKLDLPITNHMIAQFENYVDNSSALHKSFDAFISELPFAMEGKEMPLEQLKAFDSQLLSIIADGMENVTMSNEVMLQNESIVQNQNITSNDAVFSNDTMSSHEGMPPNDIIVSNEIELPNGTMSSNEGMPSNGIMVSNEIELLNGTINLNKGMPPNGSMIQDEIALPNDSMELNGVSILSDGAIEGKTIQENPNIQVLDSEWKTEYNENQSQQMKEVVVKEAVYKLLQNIFGENTEITAHDSAPVLLNKLSYFIANGENVSKESLQLLFSSKEMQEFLKGALEGQMYLMPEDVADGDKVKRLYERLESKTQKLESLLNQTGLNETPLAQTVTEVRSNVEFMNQLNQAYTFVQIPLKLSGKNASGQLYVYTNKRELNDPEKELTAFLHLDLDHLGSTDVSVKMLHKKVDTKFYMETDEAFELVKAHREELEERLRHKGFAAQIYIENEGKKVNFIDDFLKNDAPPTGQLHRYSFDVRA